MPVPSQPLYGVGARLGRWRRMTEFLSRNPSVAFGVVLVVVVTIIAVLAPVLAPYSIDEASGPVFGPPSIAHLLGLDDGGIDIVSLLMWGARISLFVGVLAGAITTLIGGSIGIVAGYSGGRLDQALNAVTNFFLVLPQVPVMIVVAALWGPSLFHIVVVIGTLQWAITARTVRAQVKSVRQRTFVRRAEALGASNARIILTHILPHVAPLLVANAVLSVASAVFAETALAFLGLGDPSATSWGKMISNGFERAAISAGAWWAIVPPGICVGLLILAFSLLGRALEDQLNPRLGTSHFNRRLFRVLSSSES